MICDMKMEDKTMAKRTHFTVNHLGEVAKFSSYKQAMEFASHMSRDGIITEVRDRTGLVGQYIGSIPTREFQDHPNTLQNL